MDMNTFWSQWISMDFLFSLFSLCLYSLFLSNFHLLFSNPSGAEGCAAVAPLVWSNNGKGWVEQWIKILFFLDQSMLPRCMLLFSPTIFPLIYMALLRLEVLPVNHHYPHANAALPFFSLTSVFLSFVFCIISSLHPSLHLHATISHL